MHVKKIDIKVEHLDVRDNMPYLRVADIGELHPARLIEEGNEMPSEAIPYDIKEYPILKMYHPEKGYSFIAIQDKELFETLFEFEKGRAAVLQRKGYDEGYPIGYTTGYGKCLQQCKKEFKKISWWRRLFNLI